MSRPHYAAVKAQIETDSALAGKGYDSARRDTAGALIRDTYWILFGGGPDDLDDNRFMKTQDVDSAAEYVYTARAVSVTADGCRAVTDKIIAATVGKTLTVTGRTLDPLRLTSSDPVDADESVKPPLYYADTELTLVSRRA